jgi:hypothetical protein
VRSQPERAAPSRTDARKQPGGEFASPDPQARAQNAALQEPRLSPTLHLRPCLHIQQFLHPASSHHTTHHAAAPKDGSSDMCQRDSCRMNAFRQIAPARDQHFKLTTPPEAMRIRRQTVEHPFGTLKAKR